MLRWWLLVLIFAINLHALSDVQVLKRADLFMKNGTKSEYFRAYNDYKNIYIKSIMSDNKKLKIQALKGIVKSGNKLHIDVSKYSRELRSLKVKSSYIPPKSKTIVKKDKNLKLKSSHKLKSVYWEDEKLVLEFDKALRSKQINYFKLYDSKKKKYRYVFDVHASMILKSTNLRKEGINRIKLAQFDTKTIRLVIENTKKTKVRYHHKKNKIIISIGKASTSSAKTELATFKRKNKVIVIDAGHGGKDPGAVGYKKYREKIVVMQVAAKVKKILKERGYRVYMTRERDKFVKLSNRTAYANKKNADIFISIHANAVGEKNARKVNGIESYFLSPSKSSRAEKVAEKENSADISEMNRYGKNTFLNFLNHHKILASNKLAIDLQRGMLGSLNKHYKNVKDGGVREGPFWVLVGAQMPAVLVEVGFISHPREAKRLVNSKYQNKLALGMANGIDRYFQNNK